MPKNKGVSGGKLITITDLEEYDQLIKYHKNDPTFNLQTLFPESKKRKKWIIKAKKFHLINSGSTKNWPHGETLLIQVPDSTSMLISIQTNKIRTFWSKLKIICSKMESF